jgi:hypothetical protein
MLMAIYLVAYTDAKRDEIAAFIHRQQRRRSLCGLDNQSRRRKVVSIEAFQVFLLASILRKDRFIIMPPTWGVNGLARRGLCDTDKCATFLEKANRSKCMTHTTIRLRKPGRYGKGKKLTVILCIETINNRQCESKNNPFKHLFRPVHILIHLNDRWGVILAPFGLLVAAFGGLGRPEQHAVAEARKCRLRDQYQAESSSLKCIYRTY